MRFKAFVFLTLIAILLSVKPVFSQTTVTVLTEGFEASSSIPSTWSQVSVSGSDVWTINNGGYYDNGVRYPSSAKTGTRNAYLFSIATTRKLVTPQLNLSGLGNITLKFWEARMKFGNDKDQLKVYYKTSSTGTWTLLASYTTETTGWVERTISLPNPSGDYYVAFEGIAAYGYGVCIDDVSITANLANDVSVTSVSVLNKTTVKATIINYGTNNLTSVKINFKVNSGTTNTYSWSGNLSSSSSTTLSIGTYNFPHGANTLTVWSSNPNAGGDGNTSNDTFVYKYSVIRNYPYRESFESADLGGWKQSTSDQMDWTRLTGPTLTVNTGPDAAYHGSYYLYTESSGNYNKRADIISVDFDISKMTNPYLEVLYHMYGTTTGSLNFDIDSNGTQKMNIVTGISGDKGNTWYKKLIKLDTFRYLNNFVIRAVTGSSFTSDIGIDDIKVLDIPFFSLGKDTSFCYGDSFTMKVDTGYGYTFLWKNLTTGDTLSLTNKLTVKNTGNYALTVSAPFGYSCSDTVLVTLRANPVAEFKLSDTAACLNLNNFSFTNQSSISSGNMTYLWDFGDNSTSQNISPTHKYNTTGTFQTKLLAISNFGCKDSISKVVFVFPQPKANFTINDTSQCLSGNYFTFTDKSTLSSGTITSFKWTFGDGNSSNTSVANHAYAAPNTYDAKLLVISDKNCKDSLTRKMLVFPQPEADFAINDSTQCLSGNTFTLTSTSTITSGQVNQFFWTFGDGNTANTGNTSHSYNSSGEYTLKLLAGSDQGCRDSAFKKVYVYDQPSASITLSDSSQCLAGNVFNFASSSTIPKGQIITYSWSFADGKTASVISPSHSYTAHGNYNVRLKVYSDQACVDSAFKMIYVRPMPKSSYNVNNTGQCLSGNNFQFTNTSTISSGTISHQWAFGDLSTSTSTHPSHQYLDTGTYSVKLLTLSNYGCKDSFITKTDVFPMPESRFTVIDSAQCLFSNSFVFQNLSSISKGIISNYHWSFGDNTSSNQKDPVHAFATEGTYLVRLTSVSNKTCSDTFEAKVIVYPMPDAAFSVPLDSQCIGGNQYNFNNSSTLSAGLLDYLWEFGDGQTSALKDPAHSYNDDGSFQVKLTAFSDMQCKDTFIRTITVAPGSVAGFDINNSIQCFNGNNFDFTNTSQIKTGKMTFRWELGDGYTATSKDIEHSFTTVDSFIVKLVAISDFSCSDSIEKTVYTKAQPKASFELVTDSIQCLYGNSFEFVNLSSIEEGTLKFRWITGAGDTLTDFEPVKSYFYSGDYVVQLFAESDFNCLDTSSRNIRVLHPAFLTLGHDTSIADTSSLLLDAGSGFLDYIWQDSSVNQTFLVEGKAHGSGVHEFFVQVTDSNNCYNADTVLITVINTGSIANLGNDFMIKVYPNPVREILNFELHATVPVQMTLQVLSADGKLIRQMVLEEDQSAYFGNIDVSAYPKGNYLLRFISEKTDNVLNFIKF